MRRPGLSRRHVGFTLIELLVALTILALLGAALLGYVRSARTAARAGDAGSTDELALRLAAELLREELWLAGAHPWPAPTSVDGLTSPGDVADFLAGALIVAAADGSTRIRLRYLDHRLSGEVVAREVWFEAGLDGRGEPQLYRRPHGSSRQPLVAGISGLRVVAGIGTGGDWIAGPQLVGRRVAALQLELAAGSSTRTLLAELPVHPLVGGP